MIALKGRWALVIPLVWIFSITGTVDLANALRQGGAILYKGAYWLIPTFVVPILLVTHLLIFTRLVRSAGDLVLKASKWRMQ